jgi:hypothetical protein
MVNKKTAFIDKRKAATYHLVCTDTGHGADVAAADDDAPLTEEERLQARVFARVAVRARWRYELAVPEGALCEGRR